MRLLRTNVLTNALRAATVVSLMTFFEDTDHFRRPKVPSYLADRSQKQFVQP